MQRPCMSDISKHCTCAFLITGNTCNNLPKDLFDNLEENVKKAKSTKVKSKKL